MSESSAIDSAGARSWGHRQRPVRPFVEPTFRLAMAFSLCLFALQAAHGEKMYKSVTPDGRVTYSAHPPADGKVLKTLSSDSASSTELPSSTAEHLRNLPASHPGRVPSGRVVLYSATWCGYCAKAKAYLAAKKIAYQEIDIDTPNGLAAFSKAGGGEKGIPLLLSGGGRIQGFSLTGYDQFFASRR